MTKVFGAFLLLFGISVSAYTQSSASANVKATVVEAVSVSKSVDSDFGNVAVILAGTVTMTPAKLKGKKGDLVLPVTSGTYTAAAYYMSGTAGYTYTISLPSAPVTIRKGTDFLKVSSFASDPTQGSGSSLSAGVFVSITPFNVMVNYN